MKKVILQRKTEPIKIQAKLYVYETIKLLIDNCGILYHYTDHVAMGYLDKETNQVDFYFETQQQYDEARKKNTVVIERCF